MDELQQRLCLGAKGRLAVSRELGRTTGYVAYEHPCDTAGLADL